MLTVLSLSLSLSLVRSEVGRDIAPLRAACKLVLRLPAVVVSDRSPSVLLCLAVIVEANARYAQDNAAQEANGGHPAQCKAGGESGEDDWPRLGDGIQDVATRLDGQRNQQRARRLKHHD